MKRKVAIVFVLFLMFFLVVVSFQKQLFSAFFMWHLKGYCQEALEANFEYSEAYIENGQWVVNDPVVSTIKSIENGGKRVQATRLVVDYAWHWFDREIDLEISVVNPRLTVGPLSFASAYPEPRPSRNKFKFFTIKSKISVEKAIVDCCYFLDQADSSNSHLISHLISLPVYLTFDGEWARRFTGHVSLRFDEHSSEENCLSCQVSEGENHQQWISLDFRRVNCSSLYHLAHSFFPISKDWNIDDGFLDGEFMFAYSPAANFHLSSGVGVVQNLKFSHAKMQISGEIPTIGVELHDDFLNINSRVSASDRGDVGLAQELLMTYRPQYSTPSSTQPSTPTPTPSSTQYSIPLHIRGQFPLFDQTQKTTLIGEFSKFPGLEASLEMKGLFSEKVIDLSVRGGRVKDFAFFLPERVQKNVYKQFNNTYFSLQASGQMKLSKERLISFFASGSVDLFDPVLDQHEMIHFGCDQADVLLIQDLGRWWIKSENVPLDKYGAAFAFEDDFLKLGGRGEFLGLIDKHHLNLRYNVKDLSVENSEFLIKAPCFGRENGSTLKDSFPAVFDYHFDTESHSSEIDLMNGSYLEKNSGLLFTDVTTHISVGNQKAEMRNLETFCNGIYFAGTLDFDYSDQKNGCFDLDIHSHTMHGKISQFQQFISKLNVNSSFFNVNVPFEGTVALRREGGFLHFSVRPEEFEVEAQIQGGFSEGKFDHQKLAIQELAFNFEYNYPRKIYSRKFYSESSKELEHSTKKTSNEIGNSLEFTDIQGALLVGDPNQVEEYALTGDYIRFNDQLFSPTEFDLWIGDKNRDLIRLVGQTQFVPSEKNEPSSGNVECILNRTLSHFGNVHPSEFELILNPLFQVETFKLHFGFQLSTMLRDLQRFGRTGLSFFPSRLLKELNALKKAKGEFDVAVEYDHQTSTLTYGAVSENIAIGNYQFKKCALQGKKKDKIWSIEELELDDFSLAAELSNSNNLWKIHFLGMRYGRSLLMGLDGDYLDKENVFDGRVNLLAVDLAQLREFASLQTFVKQWNPKGFLNATGSLRFELTEESPGWRLEALLDTSLNEVELKEIGFQSEGKVSCHYASNRGVTLEGLNGILSDKRIEPLENQESNFLSEAKIGVKSLDYDFIKREFVLEELQFKIPSKGLNWMAQSLKQHFPKIITPTIVDKIRQIKQEGHVQGVLDLEVARPHVAFRLALEEVNYRFYEEEIPFRQFVLDYDPFEMTMSAQCAYQQRNFSVLAKSRADHLESGELVVSENRNQAMTIQWNQDPQQGFFVQKAEGSLCGVTISLFKDSVKDLEHSFEPNLLHLQGELKMNLADVSFLCSQELKESMVKWGIGGDVLWKGKLLLDKNRLSSVKDLVEGIHLSGELEGRDLTCMGYQFELLSSKGEYGSGEIRLRDFHIYDSSGNLVVESAKIIKKETWMFFLPTASITDFRPFHMRHSGALVAGAETPFLIPQLDLYNFSGVIGDEMSLLGEGALHFVNPPTKNSQNMLFEIPSENLNRIGLTSAMLTPVVGSIYGEIKQGKVFLNKLKDVYSDGKLSKFYLPDRSHQSHIDFQGNIDVQIKLKQYNRLFKLTDLFTITILGTLKKPIYSLQK